MKSILSPFPVAILLGALIVVPALQGYAAYAATDNPTSIGQSTDKKPASTKQTKRTSNVRKPNARKTTNVAQAGSQNPLGGARMPADVATAQRSSNPLNGHAKPADLATARKNTAPLGQSVPRSNVATGQANRIPSPASQNIPAADVSTGRTGGATPGEFVDTGSAVATGSNPLGTGGVNQSRRSGGIRVPRQASEYLIEELSEDIDALLDQREFIRSRLIQTERELMDCKLTWEDLRVMDATDTEQEKQRRAQEFRKLEAKMMRIRNQQQVLEDDLKANAERTAEKRAQLEQVWKAVKAAGG